MVVLLKSRYDTDLMLRRYSRINIGILAGCEEFLIRDLIEFSTRESL